MKNTALFAILGWLHLAAAFSTATKQTCTTNKGPRSVSPVPTTTLSATTTTTTLFTSTLTPSTTVTPARVTKYSATTLSTVHTTVTAAKSTYVTITRTLEPQTASKTYTSVVVETTTQTATSTIHSTLTVTIAPSPDFQLANPHLRKRDPTPTAAPQAARALGSSAKFGMKRNLEERGGLLKPLAEARDNNNNNYKLKRQASFPTQVICRKTSIVQTSSTQTITAARKTFTAATPTITTVSTRFTTLTSTVTPRYTITVLVSPTSTVTKTVTAFSTTLKTTTTTTSTTDYPTETIYAACQGPFNYLDISSEHIFLLGDAPQEQGVPSAAGSAYDCCNACFASSTCEIGLWYPGHCIHVYIPGEVCYTRNDKAGVYDYVKSSNPYTIFNSNCGVWDDAGT